MHVDLHPLPDERQVKLKHWLNSPESAELEMCVEAEIAVLHGQGYAKLKELSVGYLTTGQLPQTTTDKLKAAMILELFLATLRQMRKPDQVFKTATLTIKL